MLSSTHSTQNELVGALPLQDQERWVRMLEPVSLSLGRILCEPGKNSSHVYFPTTAIVSLRHVLSDGAASEIAMVGREGLVGVCSFLGGASTLNQAIVRNAGKGYRLKESFMRDEFQGQAPVKQLVLKYTLALITQMVQTAVCNRHHSVDQRLCRCLLHSLDRTRGDEMSMTHELMSNTLGVRRSGVTIASLKLQSAGLIRYSRGRMTVLDRGGLEKRSCECHAVVKREYERLLPGRNVVSNHRIRHHTPIATQFGARIAAASAAP